MVASQFSYTTVDVCTAQLILKKIVPKEEESEADTKKTNADRDAAGLSPISAKRAVASPREALIRSIARPCVTTQFSWNMVFRFASGERCVPVTNSPDEKRDSFVHIMTQGEMSQVSAHERSELKNDRTTKLS